MRSHTIFVATIPRRLSNTTFKVTQATEPALSRSSSVRIRTPPAIITTRALATSVDRTKKMASSVYNPTNDASGTFVRGESGHRSRVGTSEFPVEPNRYLVYVAMACPWASRVTACIDLFGLEESIEVVAVDSEFQRTKPDDPKDEHMGWVFAKEKRGRWIRPDPIFNARTLREIYEKCGDFKGKFTVPVLFDKVTKRIVNNESSEIIRMMNHEFSSLARHPYDLYPVELRPSIDDVNAWVYDNINNGVYKAGFASSQQAYDKAVTALFEHLDRVEAILSKTRYICSDKKLTEADIRLFETLIRFDQVYHTHFKCNVKQIKDYPNIFNYTKEIYQLVPKTVDVPEIKEHYYKSHGWINPKKIVPRGPEFDYDQPHDRQTKFPLENKST